MHNRLWSIITDLLGIGMIIKGIISVGFAFVTGAVGIGAVGLGFIVVGIWFVNFTSDKNEDDDYEGGEHMAIVDGIKNILSGIWNGVKWVVGGIIGGIKKITGRSKEPDMESSEN